MTDPGWSPLAWRKSSRSQGNECVEVALSPYHAELLIRDSTVPDGPRLRVPLAAWTIFIREVTTTP